MSRVTVGNPTAGEFIRRGALMMLLLVPLAMAALLFAGSARAAFGFSEFSGSIAKNPAGEPARQAGSSPYEVKVTVKLNETENVPDGTPKTVVAELPVGLVGSPTATPTRCTREQLATIDLDSPLLPMCPPDSQVGFAHFVLTSGGNLSVPVYNLEPTPGAPAQFAAQVISTPVIGTARVRPGDHGINMEFRDVPQTLGLRESTFSFWGVPADPRHDLERGNACLPDATGFCFSSGTPAGTAPVPFLRLPSDCGAGLLRTTLRADQWAVPGVFESAAFDHDVNGAPIETTGCEKLVFTPTAQVQPTSTAPDSASGLRVALAFPQNENPDGLATPPLRRAVVELPQGVSINPSSATGLDACTDAQLGLGTDAAVGCPDGSKIGTAVARTPVLEDALQGAVYLRSQASSDPESGEMYRLALVLDDPERGLLIKLPGQVRADAGNGQLRATFDQSPQLPVEDIRVDLKSGPRAPLAMPASCGAKTSTAELSSWGGQVSRLSDGFDVPCTAPSFAPSFGAGSANPVAARTAPFVLRVGRNEGQPALTGITATLPKGLTAYLKGVPYCPEAAIAAAAGRSGAAELASASCPAASQAGSVQIAAGSGSTPFNVGGKAYLAGPYKGAPLSMAVVTPAVAGPFDLGTVVVRVALRIDPATAEITAISDPLPQIVKGVPLRLRSIAVSADRPGFVLNPTSCDPMSVNGSIASSGGGTADVSSRFQVTDCANLGFAPKLSLSLKGGTKRASYPALKAVLSAKPGQANIGRVSVALPRSEFLAQNHIRTVCTRVQFAADACPAGSVYGYATATTPLLDKPIGGPVYLRSSSNPLPDLVAALDGQIDIDLVGRIDSVDGGIRTTFDSVPDAPVSRFVLNMKGGKKGLLVNSRNLCSSTNRAKVLIDGQNGKAADQSPVLTNSCGKKAKKRR